MQPTQKTREVLIGAFLAHVPMPEAEAVVDQIQRIRDPGALHSLAQMVTNVYMSDVEPEYGITELLPVLASMASTESLGDTLPVDLPPALGNGFHGSPLSAHSHRHMAIASKSSGSGFGHSPRSRDGRPDFRAPPGVNAPVTSAYEQSMLYATARMPEALLPMPTPPHNGMVHHTGVPGAHMGPAAHLPAAHIPAAPVPPAPHAPVAPIQMLPWGHFSGTVPAGRQVQRPTSSPTPLRGAPPCSHARLPADQKCCGATNLAAPQGRQRRTGRCAPPHSAGPTFPGAGTPPGARRGSAADAEGLASPPSPLVNSIAAQPVARAFQGWQQGSTSPEALSTSPRLEASLGSLTLQPTGALTPVMVDWCVVTGLPLATPSLQAMSLDTGFSDTPTSITTSALSTPMGRGGAGGLALGGRLVNGRGPSRPPGSIRPGLPAGPGVVGALSGFSDGVVRKPSSDVVHARQGSKDAGSPVAEQSLSVGGMLQWPEGVRERLLSGVLMVGMHPTEVEERGGRQLPVLLFGSKLEVGAPERRELVAGVTKTAMHRGRCHLAPLWQAPAAWLEDVGLVSVEDLIGIRLVLKSDSVSLLPNIKSTMLLCVQSQLAALASSESVDSGASPIAKRTDLLQPGGGACMLEEAPVATLLWQVACTATCDAVKAKPMHGLEGQLVPDVASASRGQWLQRFNQYKQKHDLAVHWKDWQASDLTWYSELYVNDVIEVRSKGCMKKQDARDCAAREYLGRIGA